MKAKSPPIPGDMRPEYNFDYSKAARGKCYRRLLKEGANVVVLEPDGRQGIPQFGCRQRGTTIFAQDARGDAAPNIAFQGPCGKRPPLNARVFLRYGRHTRKQVCFHKKRALGRFNPPNAARMPVLGSPTSQCTPLNSWLGGQVCRKHSLSSRFQKF